MRLLKQFLCIVLLLPLMGCDELNDLAEGKFDVTTTAVFRFDIESATLQNPDDDVDIPSQTYTYNISSDPTITDVVGSDISEVEKVKILDVSYEFQNFSGNIDAKVISSFGFSGGVEHTSQSTKISEAVILRELFRVEDDLQPLSNWISANKIFGMRYSGSSTDNPVKFEVVVTVNMEVSVNLDQGNL